MKKYEIFLSTGSLSTPHIMYKYLEECLLTPIPKHLYEKL